MIRNRDVLSFFANPFVVLADVMVSIMFILSLFLITTSVYTEQMELIVQRNARRQAIAGSLLKRLQEAKLVGNITIPEEKVKYQLGNVVEVEDDGTLQRLRFLSGRLDFKPNSTSFRDPRAAQQILQVIGRLLLENRPHIKSIVIEGHAMPSEHNAWPLSLQRAESIRATLARMRILGDVKEEFNSKIYLFLITHTPDGRLVPASVETPKLWDPHRFNEWHLQEYQASRMHARGQANVIPSAWVIPSGRGDQLRRLPLVEFKIEYTERDAPPLNQFLKQMPDDLQKKARLQGLISND